MTPHHKISFGSSSLPHFNKNNFLSQYLHRHNSLRFHPCAHPQHMKVLKHFIYLYIGCWMQSAGLCSLNHDTTTSIGSTLPQLYKNKFPTSAHPHGYNSLSKVAPIYIQYGCGMQSVVVPSLNHGSTISFGSILLLHFSKKSPPPTCTGVTV
jgi:hypothetical protein